MGKLNFHLLFDTQPHASNSKHIQLYTEHASSSSQQQNSLQPLGQLIRSMNAIVALNHARMKC